MVTAREKTPFDLLRPGLGWARIADAPDRPAGIVRDEQCAIFRDRQRGRATPYLGAVNAGGPEADGEVLVPAFGLAILERHAHHLVAGRLGPVPRALESDERASAEFRR